MTPLPIRHILFPYDFSEQGRQAAPFVKALAQSFGARLTLFSTVPPALDAVPAPMGGAVLHAGDLSTDWKRALRCRLDRALMDEFAGVPVERVADCGDPAHTFGIIEPSPCPVWSV